MYKFYLKKARTKNFKFKNLYKINFSSRNFEYFTKNIIDFLKIYYINFNNLLTTNRSLNVR